MIAENTQPGFFWSTMEDHILAQTLPSLRRIDRASQTNDTIVLVAASSITLFTSESDPDVLA
jgi:hypothetical protein